MIATFKTTDFAAHLGTVVNRIGGLDYIDPYRSFTKVHPTVGLKGSLDQAFVPSDFTPAQMPNSNEMLRHIKAQRWQRWMTSFTATNEFGRASRVSISR